MANIVTDLTCELTSLVKVKCLRGNLFSQDNAANTINVSVLRNGEPESLSGTITANVIRADGSTVAVSGAFDGNVAYIVLPQACYAIPGIISIVIKNTQGSTVTTIAAVITNVYQSSTDVVVDPGTIIPSIETLISQIEDAVDSIPVDYSDLLNTIADDYTSKPYAVGEYAWQAGALKRCIVPITVAETYTAAHWTNAILGKDLSALKSALTLQGCGEITFSDFVPGVRSASNPETISTNTARVTSKTVFNLKAGDVISVSGTYTEIKYAIAGKASSNYDSGWKTADFSYTVERDGTYFANCAKTDGTSSIVPSDATIEITIKDNNSSGNKALIEVKALDNRKVSPLYHDFNIKSNWELGGIGSAGENVARDGSIRSLYLDISNLSYVAGASGFTNGYISLYSNNSSYTSHIIRMSVSDQFEFYLSDAIKAYPTAKYLRIEIMNADSDLDNYNYVEIKGIEEKVDQFELSLTIKKVNEKALFPVKSGEVFVISSLSGSVFPSGGRLNLYDANGNYLNYYGLTNATSRTITSALDFEYVSVGNVQSINIMIQKNESFGENIIQHLLTDTGIQRGDIDSLNALSNKYKDEATTIVGKYGGNANPGLCDARFAWITDLHQESSRLEHFANLVHTLGTDIVPFVLNTGDTVSNIMSNGITWYNNIVSDMDVPVLNTVGNHDTYVTNGNPSEDQTTVYNMIISPFVSDWNVVSPTGASTYGYCYYYKDISTNVRLIVLDNMYWDATQKNWFAGVLSDARTNSKHVMVAVHCPFVSSSCTMLETRWNTGWLSRDSSITDIEAMECVKDFIDAGGVFIAWLQGHVHGDEIVTLDNGRQLAICNNSFSNRGTKVMKTSNSDAYNYNSCTIVAIDSTNYFLKMYRIGADISVSGKKHNGFVWNYNTKTIVADW